MCYNHLSQIAPAMTANDMPRLAQMKRGLALSAYRRPIQVLVYVVCWTDDGWRYLPLHRVPARGAFWQGVSGGVEWGETLLHAARREVLEKTGLHSRELHSADCSYTFDLQEEWKRFYAPRTREIAEHVFVAVVAGQEPELSPEEHDDWRWCTYEEALGVLVWPENVKALQCCQQLLHDM
jgi:dATP pyrophosphohydrolase